MEEREKIVVRYDAKAMRNMAVLTLLAALAVAAVAVICWFSSARYRSVMFMVVLGLLAAGLVYVAVTYFIKLNNPVVLTVKEKKIYVRQAKGGAMDLKEVQMIAASVSFGKWKNPNPEGKTLKELACAPPIAGLRGDLYLAIGNRQLKFVSVADVFGAVEKLKDLVPDYQVLLWSGQNKEEYLFWNPERGDKAGEQEKEQPQDEEERQTQQEKNTDDEPKES